MTPPIKERLASARQTAKHTASQADRLAKRAEQYSPTEAVCIEIPVRIQGSQVVAVVREVTEHTEPFQEETSTLIVFPQGAVVRLSARVAPGQELTMTSRRTNQAVSCRVVKVRSYMGGKGYVEIEFAERATGFWGISFPSEASGRPSEFATPPATASSKPEEPLTALPSTDPAPAIVARDNIAPFALSAPEKSDVADFRLVPPVLASRAASLATAEPSEQEQPACSTSPADSTPHSGSAGAPIAASPLRDGFGGAGLSQEGSSAARDPIAPAFISDAAKRVRPLDLTSLADEVTPASPSRVSAGSPPPLTDRRESFRSSEGRAAPKRERTWSRPGIFGTRLGQRSGRKSLVSEAQLRRILVFGSLSVCALIGIWLGARFFLQHPPASAAGTPENSILISAPVFVPSKAEPRTVPPSGSISSKVQSYPSTEARPGSGAQNSAASDSAPPQQGSEPSDDTSRLLAMPAGKIAAPAARRGKAAVQGEEPLVPVLGGGVPSEVPGGQGRSILGGILPGASATGSALPPPPVGGRVNPPQLLSSVSPAYPSLAKKYNVQGDVTIQANIDSAGNIVRMKVISGPALLHQAAMDALRQWKYLPAKLNEQPVPMQILVTIKFRLQ